MKKPRGILGIQGIAGKVVIPEKQKFQHKQIFPDNSLKQTYLGNVVTFGETSEQFQNLQQAIDEVAKVASSGFHGIVLVSPGEYRVPSLSLPFYVDLVAPFGKAGIDSENYVFRIHEVGTTGASGANRFQGLSLAVDSPPSIMVDAISSTMYFEHCSISGIEPFDQAHTLRYQTIFAENTEFRSDDIDFQCPTWSLTLNLQYCSLRNMDILVPNSALTLRAFNCKSTNSKIQAEGYRIQIFIKDCVLYSTTAAPLSLNAANITDYIRTCVSHSLLCGPTHTIENIGGGTVELWTANNQLQTGYSAGTNEHIATPDNNIDAQFLISCQQAF